MLTFFLIEKFQEKKFQREWFKNLRKKLLVSKKGRCEDERKFKLRRAHKDEIFDQRP